MSNIYPIHKAPYTNFHDLNLDWIIEVLNEFNARLTNFVSLATIKYADPIQWDITSQYEANTVVIDSQGNAYLSVQPVPSGVSLDRTEYWTKIGNFDELWSDVKKAITPNDEGHSTTATAARAVDDLVWVNGVLVRITRAMSAGDAYVSGSNCVTSSTNEVLHYLLAALNAEQQAREDEDTQLHTALDAEQQAREEADNGLQGTIDKLQQDIDKLIDYANVKSYGAKGDGVTDDTDAVKAALATGKDLFFPDGNYLITGGINIGSPLMTHDAVIIAQGVTITMASPVAPCCLHFKRTNDGKFKVTEGQVIGDWFIDAGLADVFRGGSLAGFTGTITFPSPCSWDAQNDTVITNTPYHLTNRVFMESHTRYDFCGGVISFDSSTACISASEGKPERSYLINATLCATVETVANFTDATSSGRIFFNNLHCIGGRQVGYYKNTVNVQVTNVIHDCFYASSASYSSFVLDETSGGLEGISGNASIRFYNCISSMTSLAGDSSQFIIYNSNDIRDIFIDDCECSGAHYGIQINSSGTDVTTWNIFIRNYVADQCNRGVYCTNLGRGQITIDSSYFNAKDKCIEFVNTTGAVTNCFFLGSQESVGIALTGSQGAAVTGNQFINMDHPLVVQNAFACQIGYNIINRSKTWVKDYAFKFLGNSMANRIVCNSVIPAKTANFYTAAFRFESTCTGNIIGLNHVAGVELSNEEADLKKINTTSV